MMRQWNVNHAIERTATIAWSGKSWAKHGVRHLEKFAEFIGHGVVSPSELPLNEITTSDLDAYAERLEAEGLSDSTINRHLASISKMFTVAVQRGGLDKRPYIPRRAEAEGRVRFLSKAEENAMADLIFMANPRASDMMTVLIDTGMRLSEAEAVFTAVSRPVSEGSCDVDFRGGTITLWQTKNGKPRTIPMTKRVRHVLSKYAPKMTHMQNAPVPITANKFRQVWNGAREALGYADDPQFVPHALRHTCASRLVQAGVPLKVIQEWMGHKSIQVTERYSHLCPDNFKQAVQALEG